MTSHSASDHKETFLLCRYCDNEIEKKLLPLVGTEYVAISHIWGTARWQEIQGIEHEVLVSDDKARFIREKLRNLVGDSWFWMDILCVDQRNKAARVAVTADIPKIFRLAHKTIVIRDGSAFQPCCVEALDIKRANGSIDGSKLLSLETEDRLMNHVFVDHRKEEYTDGVLTRLWPFQEVILSQNIEFHRCEPQNSRLMKTRVFDLDLRNFLASIKALSKSWSSYGQNYGETNDLLIEAYLICGTASRLPGHTPLFPFDRDMIWLNSSTRRTTKPRDFVLALMPQYAFYRVPKDAKEMTLGQLLVNFFYQLYAEEARPDLAPIDFAPLITRPGPEGPCATEDLPDIVFLSDFVKLFYGPRLSGLYHQSWVIDQRVNVRICANLSKDAILKAGYKAMEDSPIACFDAFTGEIPEITGNLSQSDQLFIFDPDDFEAAGHPVANIDDRSTFATLQELVFLELRNFYNTVYDDSKTLDESEAYIRTQIYLRLTALVVCGLGITSYQWSKRTLTPVLVECMDQVYLALVFKNTLETPHEFCLVRTEMLWRNGKNRYALIARKEGDGTAWEKSVLCFFPAKVQIEEKLASASEE